jgi:hypothetical protein
MLKSARNVREVVVGAGNIAQVANGMKAPSPALS